MYKKPVSLNPGKHIGTHDSEDIKVEDDWEMKFVNRWRSEVCKCREGLDGCSSVMRVECVKRSP